VSPLQVTPEPLISIEPMSEKTFEHSCECSKKDE
jgi:hypothetical protein